MNKPLQPWFNALGRMVPSLARGCCGWLLLSQMLGGTPGWAAPPLCPAQLQGALGAIARQGNFQRGHWGMLVQTQGEEPITLYAHQADHFFVPASGVKLLTTAAALTALGPDLTLQTQVYQQPGTPILRVVGAGDPSLDVGDLTDLARQIRATGSMGLTQLRGDDSLFQGVTIPPTWEWGDLQAGYGAPVNSLMVHQNAIDLVLEPQALGQPLRVTWGEGEAAADWTLDNRSMTVGTTEPEFITVDRTGPQGVRIQGQLRVGAPPDGVSLAVPDPPQYFLAQFQRALAAQGIPVETVTLDPTPLPLERAIAQVTSPPLADLLLTTNQESQNLYAETLVLLMGTRLGSPQGAFDPGEHPRDAGLRAIAATLTRLGVDPEGYHLADGSGLSRHNLARPRALVQTLQAMARSPHAPDFQRSLAIAGVSGTLASRFQGTPVVGRLQGKTGTLTGVISLSGYLQPPDHAPLVFSLILNHVPAPAAALRPVVDDMVLALATLKPC